MILDRATEYARRVVAGKVVAGKPHIQACQRHLNDLEKSFNDSDYPFYWDVEAANRILDYAETLTIAEGSEPRPLELHDFQCFDLGVPFGWLKKSNDCRRFRRLYKSVARQNGKTFENGIRGSYIAGFSGYNYGKLFTVATKHAQAKLAWDEIAKFINVDDDLTELFKVQEYKTVITALTTNCTIEALSKERSLDDGFRSIFSSVDEIHQHKDNSIYKAIYNGTRALKETLVSMITTRGNNLNSFCYEMDSYCLNILNGTATAEDFFVDIYCLDKEDDIWDEKNWIKSNPYLARTEGGMETLRTDAQTAKDMGGMDLRDFLIKCLNMWSQNADNQFINVEKWKICGSNRTLEDFRGRDCWVGLDLSSGGDLTTLALEFEEPNNEYYLYSHSFMPRGRLEEHVETDLAPYDLWETKGLLTVTGGVMDYKNDYKFIIKHLKEIQERYNLTFLGIGYDPHNADGILSDLEEFGCPLLMITQSARFLNDATVDVQLSCKSEKLEYDEQNELLTWSFTNAKVVKNSFGEMKVDKEPRAKHKRIDPVDAVIDAHTMMLKTREEPAVDVENEMEKYLEMMGWKK
ncbi:terminase large subunit [Bacillus sp. JJ722]|uniref:terminase large subunit n=1 Tax=Bacillus sp. JJ722 TaxID=3122973 RepID=UPI003000E8AA